LSNGEWWLVNEELPDLTNMTGGKSIAIAISNKIKLLDGKQLLLDRNEGGRLVGIQMIDT
jgi:hypothetical protein